MSECGRDDWDRQVEFDSGLGVSVDEACYFEVWCWLGH